MSSQYASGFGSNISFGALNQSSSTLSGLFNSGSGSVDAHIMQTVDLNSPAPETGDIKVTNNDSPKGNNPNGTHEYGPGMTEPGDVEYDVVYVKGLHEAQLLARQGDGVIYAFREAFPDGTLVYYPGYFKSVQIEGKTEDDALKGKIKLKLSGPCLWS